MRRQVGKVFLTVLILAAIGLPATLFAQTQPPAGFSVVDPNTPHETIPHVQLVMAAYAFVWLTLIVYVWSLWRRITRVERELVGVTQQLRERKR